jgi:hypothetical protein
LTKRERVLRYAAYHGAAKKQDGWLGKMESKKVNKID